VTVSYVANLSLDCSRTVQLRVQNETGIQMPTGSYHYQLITIYKRRLFSNRWNNDRK